LGHAGSNLEIRVAKASEHVMRRSPLTSAFVRMRSPYALALQCRSWSYYVSKGPYFGDISPLMITLPLSHIRHSSLVSSESFMQSAIVTMFL